MNITDVIPPVISPETTLLTLAREMSMRQTDLENEYFKIEGRKDRFVWSLDNRDAQIYIKDMLWRIMEEVGEALQTLDNGEINDKFYEELADGLHFVIGLCCNTLNPIIWENGFNDLRKGDQLGEYDAVVLLVKRAGMLGNTLKLKPWKQTDITTDVIQFRVELKGVVDAYLYICWAFGLTPHTLFQYYWRKSEVNLFRIRSKY